MTVAWLVCGCGSPWRVCLRGRPMPCPWGRAVGWGAGVASFGVGHASACRSLREMVSLAAGVSPSGVGLERRAAFEQHFMRPCENRLLTPGRRRSFAALVMEISRRFAPVGRRRHYLWLRFGSDGGLCLPVSIAPRAGTWPASTCSPCSPACSGNGAWCASGAGSAPPAGWYSATIWEGRRRQSGWDSYVAAQVSLAV